MTTAQWLSKSSLRSIRHHQCRSYRLKRFFVYPRKGQSEEQQAKDRYECHIWAVGQIGWDPTQPTGAVPEAQMNQKRADYKRAMGACLDAHDYTVK